MNYKETAYRIMTLSERSPASLNRMPATSVFGALKSPPSGSTTSTRDQSVHNQTDSNPPEKVNTTNNTSINATNISVATMSNDYHQNILEIQKAFRRAEESFFHDDSLINVLKESIFRYEVELGEEEGECL